MNIIFSTKKNKIKHMYHTHNNKDQWKNTKPVNLKQSDTPICDPFIPLW